jgi:hypothetical protein
MAGIITPITDLINKIQTGSCIKYCRIWNNQFKYMEAQQIESYPFPCAFIEVLMPNNYDQLGLGFTASEVTFRIHIGQTQYDAGDGTMEQNTSIFNLRNTIITLLTYYEPPLCSALQKVSETQDYEHTNVYHYIIDFKCSYIDEPGDQTTSQIIKQPPTTLIDNATITPQF